MSMLAGPKRKQKWTLNPRGKHWTEDSNKFGQKMLEKMGWSSGKGLGAKGQGSVEPIRVKVKNDQVGIGFDKNRDDHWTEHQDSFEDFLQNLQKEQSMDSADTGVVADKALSGKSLEEKSKQSQKRVHYKKFTRGKDVNKYSSKDLANIFGKKDLNEKTIKEEIEEESVEKFQDPVGTKDTTAGILTIKGGSMTDYFKKFQHDEQKSTSQNVNNSDSETETRTGFGFNEKSKSKFYLNDTASPEKAEADDDTGKYASFGFIKSSESKSKSKKSNNLDYVFDNPCLDLNILDSPVPQKVKLENANLEANDKPTPRKRKSEFIYENEGLDLECPDRPTPKKRKKEFSYENEGLDLEYPDNSAATKEVSNNDVHENENRDADYSAKATPKKSKKKKKASVNGYENSALDLESADRSTAQKCEEDNNYVSEAYENAGLDLEYQDKVTPKKTKKKKESEVLSCAYENPALNLEFPDRPTPKVSKEVDSENVLNQVENTEDLEKKTSKKLKKSKKSEVLSNGIENPGLDLEFPDNPTPKKVKKSKEIEILNGIENPGLDLKFPDNPTPKKMKKSKEVEILNGIENPGLDLEFPDNPTPKKIKKSKDVEILNGIENPGLDLEFPDNPTPKKVKKSKDVEILNGIENPGLDLEFSDNPTPKKIKKSKEIEILNGIENRGLDLECTENPTPKKMKKRKEELPKVGGFENCALDLDNSVNIDDNTSDFEVLRSTCGVDNTGLDLSDEKSSKKRVTFNNQIEYNTDVVKKKKKKRKLDKYEVGNEKLKKKDKSTDAITFINETLDVEVLNEEEIDNEINERKSKKGKRRKNRRMSQLETIEETPEEENVAQITISTKNHSDIEIVKEFVHENQNCEVQEVINEQKCKQKGKKTKSKNVCVKDTIEIDELDEDSGTKEKVEEINESLIKKKKKKNTIKVENTEELKVNGGTHTEKENMCIDKEDTENTIQRKEKKRKRSDEDIVSLEEFLNEEPETSVKSKENTVNQNFEGNNTENYFQKMKKTKQVMKSLFMKNPTLLFNGANINEINGYGSNIQNNH